MWSASNTVEIIVLVVLLAIITLYLNVFYMSLCKADLKTKIFETIETFESLIVSGASVGDARRLALRWNRCEDAEVEEFDRMVELKFGVSWEALGVELESDREGIIFDTLIKEVRTHSRSQRRDGQR